MPRFSIGKSRREARLAALDAFRHSRRAVNEDVTTFGEELAELHVETLATPLDEGMRQDYQRALDAYEAAKDRLARAEVADDVSAVTRALAEGRFAHACVLAARDARPRPTRHEPCFFDPAHGPAERDVEWAPPGGVPRSLPVCFRDFERLTIGDEPDARLVPLGNRRVPWFASGPLYAPWAAGWYDDYIHDGRMEPARLTMVYAAAGMAGTAAGTWSDPGSWDGGGFSGGHFGGTVGDFGGDGGGGGGGGADGGGF
ncbi:hypothetical protein [Nocardioides piscis]|uniref:Uncharacterized protein n=1 Tax=Nocardioides piscis TaxID=2714938 RepID=A0A6G7YFI3_9ACTN|nr:hypothetical protein [Nocardioides piscis]QIK75553.1 hypothetical protein G7071_08985 [Nocardioides piscis]